ncbi:SDR family oxidoreductase [Aurantibacter sp.]|uniref:SDR family oxidoreductase n=1 Tax=Aurantibacter sp. TaxID=2807103 RepID=UPI0032646EC6
MTDLFNLKDKVAIITGASGTLAGEAAICLSNAGVKLALLSRNKSSVSDLIKLLPNKAVAFESDVLSEVQLIATREEVLKEFGGIDILINSAGGNLPGATIPDDKTIFDLDMADFQKVNELNLNGTVLPSIVFGKTMAENKKGVMINYSSMAVAQAINRVPGYSASKAAMENFTRWMAVEMATKFGDGIRVNAIAPGFFIAKQNKAVLINEDGSYTKRGNAVIQKTPMRRFGNTDELNGAIHFLCSDAAKFITGAVLPIDGGFSAFSGV